MPRRHMHIEPSSQSGGFVNNVEKIGKAAVQVGGCDSHDVPSWERHRHGGEAGRPLTRISLAFK